MTETHLTPDLLQKWNMKRSLVVTLVLLFFFVLPCFADLYTVVRVVDGDTIDIDYNGEKERIRLLNVDTPESVHPNKTKNTELGKKASDYTKKRLTGKSVSLEFGGKKRGKYGRLLAYVILDKNNFNLELVQKGWSPYYTKYGKSYAFHAQFTAAQTMARANGLNIWAEPILISKNVQSGEYLAPALPPTDKTDKSAQLARADPFHGNIKSHKFHKPNCRYFNCNSCTKIFSSRDAALLAGYSPCKLCSP